MKKPTLWEPVLGANVCDSATRFRVWAPQTGSVEVVFGAAGDTAPVHAMERTPGGFHAATVDGVGHGDLYRYRLDGRGPFPDPVSRFQPLGVHGPSQIVDWRRFEWTDLTWSGISLDEAIIYELHVGTFTPQGTFAAAAEQLPVLTELGVTAVELMPVGDFAGRWNWGYDGVAPFAPARCYGTPDDLRRFVDVSHSLGMAVYLDVVYNHLGPDGAYQGLYSPFYYSQTHRSLWGAGINFDGPQNGPVRDYAIQNALAWIHEFHMDGLRLDATHAIVDDSRVHIVADVTHAARASLEGTARRVQIVAEDTRNLSHMVKPVSHGGWGLDGLWSDDFHHQLRRAVAGDHDGYFQDFDGTSESIAVTATQGWFYTGQYAPYFGRPRGTDPAGIPLSRFVFFVQNHDQVGNRAFGERLHHQIDLAVWRAVSTLFLILPETPLLFMGQEWACGAPFLYFTDHAAELGRLVTEGRRREFSCFAAFAAPQVRERIPDPQSEDTYRASVLDWRERHREPHASVLRLYRRLIALRRQEPALRHAPPGPLAVSPYGENGVQVWRQATDGRSLLAVVRLRGAGGGDLAATRQRTSDSGTCWKLVLTTEDPLFAPDSSPPRVRLDPLTVEFTRPGAVVFLGESENSPGQA